MSIPFNNNQTLFPPYSYSLRARTFFCTRGMRHAYPTQLHRVLVRGLIENKNKILKVLICNVGL